MDDTGLSSLIIKCFEKHGLEYHNNLVGHGYGRNAVMTGKPSCVCTQIQDVAKCAYYVHCKVHRLYLVIVDSVKSLTKAGCFLTFA